MRARHLLLVITSTWNKYPEYVLKCPLMLVLDLQYHWRKIQTTNSSLPLLSKISLYQTILGWSPSQAALVQLTKYTPVRKGMIFCSGQNKKILWKCVSKPIAKILRFSPLLHSRIEAKPSQLVWMRYKWVANVKANFLKQMPEQSKIISVADPLTVRIL